MPSDEFEYEDEDQIETQDTTEEVDVEVDDEEEAAGNPALAELYDVLPKSLHGLVEPVINKWQAGIDQQFEKIAPYRRYADAGVDPQVIEASLELAAEISANPKAVYDELASRYGFAAAQQIMEDAVDTAEAYDSDFEEDESTAELRALKAEIDALKGDREQEIAQREAYAMDNEIEETVAAIQQEFGDFDEEAVIRRAMLLADDYPNAELHQLIGAAHEQYMGEIKAMQASVKRAPRVAGGAGNSSIPAPPAPKLTTREERIAAIEEIAKRNLAGFN
jgi:hypothetical protein